MTPEQIRNSKRGLVFQLFYLAVEDAKVSLEARLREIDKEYRSGAYNDNAKET